MRPFELTVEDHPPLNPKRWYLLVIRNISRATGKRRGIQVELALLDPEQVGLVHREVLELPVMSGNLTAESFHSLGFSIDVGQNHAASPQSKSQCNPADQTRKSDGIAGPRRH